MIIDIFKDFYINLYKDEKDSEESVCKQYLAKLEFSINKESLEAPFSLEVLYKSLKSLQKGKSLGLDGLPTDLYLEI